MSSEENDIKVILLSRYAVYKLGVKHGAWMDLEKNSASDFMDVLFPHSGHIAYYHLMIEIVKSCHKAIPSGAYNLFKLPEHLEQQILTFLKSKSAVWLDDTMKSSEEYLNRIAIPAEPTAESTCVGRLEELGISDTIGLMAFHYLNAFSNNRQSYPYCE